MTPEQAGTFLSDYGPFIWVIFITIVFIGGVVKMWPFITSVVKTVEIITGLPTELKYIHDKLDTLEVRIINVETEVKLNSGSSLKDAVKRIEDRLDNI
jgi:hypothetical protein